MKLNLGCGWDIRDGYVNLDISPLDGVDVVWDITKLPLPFKDEEFEEILCADILEHVQYEPVLKDLHRILKKGGSIKLTVPHFTSLNNYVDPTHRRMFSIKTFTFFTKDSFLDRTYYFDFSFSKIAKAKITFSKYFIWDRILEFVINKHPKLQTYYEMTGLSRVFPAENCEVELVK